MCGIGIFKIFLIFSKRQGRIIVSFVFFIYAWKSGFSWMRNLVFIIHGIENSSKPKLTILLSPRLGSCENRAFHITSIHDRMTSTSLQHLTGIGDKFCLNNLLNCYM